jgi:hypothetical protein
MALSDPGPLDRFALIGALWLAALAAARAETPPPPGGRPPPEAWAALARLPDWSGLWTPIPAAGPNAPFGATDPPWTPEAAAQIAALRADEKAGKPHNVYIDCLPEGMPSFMMMTQAAFEVLFTPGRVTILGELDGNRLRRIHTDGRGHAEDPDLTFNGDSIGHWEGETLVIDTTAILPESYLPLGQAVALPSNGDMHIVEHLRLTAPDVLTDDLEITAPRMLTGPWKTSRSFRRRRGFSIVEASCRQGDFIETKDAHGNAVFAPLPHDEGGDPLPPTRP